jgi:hypothetical protein
MISSKYDAFEENEWRLIIKESCSAISLIAGTDLAGNPA